MNSRRSVDNRSTKLPSLVCLAAWLLAATASAPGQSTATNPYFGQTPPGSTPVRFAPGTVATSGRTEERVAFSPDGRECFFAVTGPADGTHYGVSFTIFRSTQRSDGTWPAPVVAEFSGTYWDASPVFSADGSRLYFVSRRPYPGQGAGTTYQTIWYVEKISGAWSQPQFLSNALIRTQDVGYVSVSANGNVYFIEYTVRGSQHTIYRSRCVNGVYQTPENLNASLSSSANYLNDPFVAADESYLVFNRGVPGNMLRVVSFRRSDDSWTQPVLIDNYLSGAGMPYMWAMSLTPDMRYLFFTGQNSPEADVYWRSADFIEGLNPLPRITTQPLSQTVVAGGSVTFSVAAAGNASLSYQWQLNGAAITGATSASLTINNAQTGNAGTYVVTVTNATESATSNGATLTVLSADQAFLQRLFLGVMGRPIDAGALNGFAAALAGGRTRAQVYGDLVGSVEYANRQVEPAIRLYNAALARPPDYGGLQNWSNALRVGALTLTGAADQFAGSEEFLLHYGALDNTQFVQQLYRNVLGREADDAGLADWVGRLDAGASRGAILVGFSESDEFKRNMADQVEIVRLYFLLLQRVPTAVELQDGTGFLKGYDQTDAIYLQGYPSGMSSASYVTLVFQGFLRREADAGALSTYVAALAAGTVTHGSLVETVMNSDEFNLFVAPVSRLYLAALRRVPDQPGLNNWVNYVRAGTSLQVMADAFASSQEFMNRYGAMSNRDYVAQLYRDVLGREADPDGLADWTGRLDAGTATRGGILIGFSESQEAIHLFAPTLRTFLHYFTFLNAAPTQEDLDYWRNYLATLTDQMRLTFLDDTGSTN